MQTKKQKENIVKDLAEKLKKTKAAVFADYTGLSVAKLMAFRRKLKAENSEIKVAKKTLIDLALKQADLPATETQLGWAGAKKMSGQVALVMGYGDEISPAKASFAFTRGNEHFKILGGILENKFIETAQVLSLAKIPGRQELLGKLVFSIASPMSGMVGVLQGNLRGLVRVLSQINK